MNRQHRESVTSRSQMVRCEKPLSTATALAPGPGRAVPRPGWVARLRRMAGSDPHRVPGLFAPGPCRLFETASGPPDTPLRVLEESRDGSVGQGWAWVAMMCR